MQLLTLLFAVTLNAPVRVPMTYAHHLPVVEIRINDQGPYRFAVDSGAAMQLAVSPALAESLHLVKAGEALASDPSGKNPQRRDVVSVASAQIGAARFEGLTATVGGPMFRDVDGIAGYGLFRDLLLTLDYPNHELRIEQGALPPADGKTVLALVEGRKIPAVTLHVGDKTITCDIDAGSPALLTLPLEFGKSLPLKSEPVVFGHGRTASGEFDIYGADLDADVSLGGMMLRRPHIDLVEHFPTANVGYQFLKNYSVTFDAKNGRVAFGRSTPAESPRANSSPGV